MYLITTSIEISASPADMRQKFLDFSQIPNYSPNGFFKSIGPAIPNESLEPGIKMHNVLEGATIDPILIENSPACFRWQGSMAGVLNAEHSFRFRPSITIQGGTTFVHEESFTGVLAFLMGDSFVARAMGLRENTRKGFEGYNRDLKNWCEVSKSGK